MINPGKDSNGILGPHTPTVALIVEGDDNTDTPPPPTLPQAGPVQQEPMPGVPMEVAGVSGMSPVKKEGASSEPVVVVGARK